MIYYGINTLFSFPGGGDSPPSYSLAMYGPIIGRYKEDITRWREHMKFISSGNILSRVSPLNEWNIFFHEKINFICSSQHEIFFTLHGYECFENKTRAEMSAQEKQKNDVSDIFTSEDMKNMSLISRM